MTTITDGTTTWTPELVDGLATPRPSRNVFHDVLGTTDTALTLRPAGLRHGTIKALFVTKADADALVAGLAQAKTFTVADTDPSFSIKFALDGDVEPALDDELRDDVWWVTFGFREVP